MRAGRGALFFLSGEELLELFDVVEVVAGHHADEMLDGFLAALGVHAEVLPLLGREGFQERDVGFAHDAEHFERLARVAFGVMERGGPGVLVEGLDGCAGGAENLADAPGGDGFGVGEVRENFGDGPFIGSGALAQFHRGLSAQQAGDFFRRGGLDLQGVLAFDVAEDALCVFLRSFGHGVASLRLT